MSCVGCAISSSPPVRDPLSRLEYLLQNLLVNFTQIVTVVAPEASQSTQINTTELPDVIKEKITELTDKVIVILKAIDENIDFIPDSTIPLDEIRNCISKLHQENTSAAKELCQLEHIFDFAYRKARDLSTHATDTDKDDSNE
ncbi:hypothetical protein BMR1_02g01145 [Babesia microti strain RI]|uniref:Mediator of RNA polymerase II transcription subunit 21 n=1 Tax=Babesia microti (strain RI) TaxID=1133968 RepID=I7J612_BABMR|nr:hypothetical protein BMR1_02g01145 [Babesia microti strain RI]CCF73392.1 hypothetical protein BMR1_02g01145 [Babesia microti strain RI]|eukprot:XP_012648001.1 hypothetical protein BMR1_02g01145 [Babesia microti strain RI]